jgi:hypothetical protein
MLWNSPNISRMMPSLVAAAMLFGTASCDNSEPSAAALTSAGAVAEANPLPCPEVLERGAVAICEVAKGRPSDTSIKAIAAIAQCRGWHVSLRAGAGAFIADTNQPGGGVCRETVDLLKGDDFEQPIRVDLDPVSTTTATLSLESGCAAATATVTQSICLSNVSSFAHQIPDWRSQATSEVLIAASRCPGFEASVRAGAQRGLEVFNRYARDSVRRFETPSVGPDAAHYCATGASLEQGARENVPVQGTGAWTASDSLVTTISKSDAPQPSSQTELTAVCDGRPAVEFFLQASTPFRRVEEVVIRTARPGGVLQEHRITGDDLAVASSDPNALFFLTYEAGKSQQRTIIESMMDALTVVIAWKDSTGTFDRSYFSGIGLREALAQAGCADALQG